MCSSRSASAVDQRELISLRDAAPGVRRPTRRGGIADLQVDDRLDRLARLGRRRVRDPRGGATERCRRTGARCRRARRAPRTHRAGARSDRGPGSARASDSRSGGRPSMRWLGGIGADVSGFSRSSDCPLPVERQHAGDHLVDDDGERVDVRATVDAEPAHVLGRDVAGRPEELLVHRERRLAGDLRDAEVGELHVLRLGVVRRRALHEQDVLGLEIAMDDAHLVRASERARDLHADAQRARPRERGRAGS